MDIPASRRGWRWKDRKNSFQEHKWFFIGFSGLASILMVLPIVNLLVLPAAVAGLSRADVMKKREVT
jgi:CysZ protein